MSVTEDEARAYAQFWFDCMSVLKFHPMPMKHERSRFMRRDLMPWKIQTIFAACGVKADQAACDRYWTEIRKGQDVREDVDSYLWRAWAVSLGIRKPGDVLTRCDIERAMEDDRSEKVLSVIDHGSPLAHLPPAICLICGEEPIAKGFQWADEGLCSHCKG